MKCAVIGLGGIAARHRKNIKNLLPSALVYAMSASGREIIQVPDFADGVCESIQDIVDQNPAFVIIASPASMHTQHALPFIEFGIPVLIEKPLSASVEQANALVQAYQSSQTQVAIGYCLRFMPAAQKLKQMLESNLIGDIYHCSCNVGQYLPDWRPNKHYSITVSANAELGGGVLLELSHELDYLKWLLGDLVFEHGILHHSSVLEIDVEEMADITLVSKSGTICHLHLDFLQHHPQRKCVLTGSLGRIEWDLAANSLELHTATEQSIIHADPHWDRNLMYVDMLKSFFAQLEPRQLKDSTVFEAAQTITLINEIKSKAKYIGGK